MLTFSFFFILFHLESGNDYVCDAGAIGNCDCGKAKTCVCTVGVGNCVAEDVTDKVTCTVGTGNCVVGSATETVCDVTTGNCESGSAKVSCTVQTGNCNGKKATTSFKCKCCACDRDLVFDGVFFVHTHM